MKRLTVTAVAVASLSLPAFAQAPAPAPAGNKNAPAPAPASGNKNAPAPAPGHPAPAPAPSGGSAAPAPAPSGMDLSKFGPASRKPASEAAIKKEVDAFFKEVDALNKAKNFEGALGLVDFPVMMITDSAAGVVETRETSRDQYVAEMKPMWDSMPADYKLTHKFTVAVLSDAIVNVVDDFTETANKKTTKGRNQELLIKVGGKWKVKVMTEAGWGGMSAAAAPAPATTATPVPAPAKSGTAAPAPAPAGSAAPAPAPAPKK